MGSRTPPRFVTRTMTTTFGTVVIMLGLVLAVVMLIVRDRVRSTVISHLTRQQARLRMDDNRYDTAAARAARKSSLVAFTRP